MPKTKVALTSCIAWLELDWLEKRRSSIPSRKKAIRRPMRSTGGGGSIIIVASIYGRVVAFLASPKASWISGTSVVVDGCQSRSF